MFFDITYSFRVIICCKQVNAGILKKFRVIPKQAKTFVAPIANNTSYFVKLMIMVNNQTFFISTNRTHDC